jgi:ribosomal protein S18 acetylase RimI-like enzyme
MNFEVRRANAQDIGALCKLWTASGIQFDPATVEPELREVLARDPELVLVATDESGIIGAVLGTFDGRRAWVNRLATRPDHKRRGVAKALTQHLQQALRQKGARKVNLLIEPENRGVVSFYQEIGFVTDELIFMEKYLDD